MRSIGSEKRLLLTLARVHLETEAHLRAVTLIQSEIDWKKIIELAIRHGVFPLVHRHLQALGSPLIPQNVLWQLQALVMMNERRNRVLKREWARLIAAFNQYGIPVLPVKGVILAESLYGDLSLRPFDDLDFHVMEADLDRCRELLEANGYYSTFPLDEFYERRTRKLRHELTFRKRGSDGVPEFLVDLQYDVAPRSFSIHMRSEDLWEDVEPVKIAGVQTYQISAEGRLIYLCLHAWKHGWCRLQWVCDIAEAVHAGRRVLGEGGGRCLSASDLDWGKIIERVEHARINRIVLHSLLLANRLLDARVPEWVLAELYRRSTSSLRRAWTGFIDRRSSRVISTKNDIVPRLGLGIPRDLFRRYLFWFSYRERFGDKLQFLVSLLRPSQTDFELLPLPERLFPLYYILRPFLLGLKLIRTRPWAKVDTDQMAHTQMNTEGIAHR